MRVFLKHDLCNYRVSVSRLIWVPKLLLGVTHDGPWFLSGLPVRASFKPCPWRPLSIISDQIKSAASSWGFSIVYVGVNDEDKYTGT